jgi:hypothetical protein
MEISYDQINPFPIAQDKFLFFDIFHKNNDLYLICPVYTFDMTEIENRINSISIKSEDKELEIKLKIYKIAYEPTLILIYNFNSQETINKITVKYNNLTNIYKLCHRQTTKNNYLAVTTLFKEDYKSIDIFYDYYEKHGYDHYFMYYNGKLTDEIKTLYNKSNITLIEWDFPYWNEDGWTTSIQHHAQLGQMHNAIYKYGKNEFEYMAFHDLDEYLYLQNKIRIKDFIYESNLVFYGFLNIFSNTVDSSGNTIIPNKMPNQILVDKIAWPFCKCSKVIYKVDRISTIGIHHPREFVDSEEISYNASSVMFHMQSWSGRTRKEIVFNPITIELKDE